MSRSRKLPRRYVSTLPFPSQLTGFVMAASVGITTLGAVQCVFQPHDGCRTAIENADQLSTTGDPVGPQPPPNPNARGGAVTGTTSGGFFVVQLGGITTSATALPEQNA